MDRMPRLNAHPPSAGVLCWGGPKHGAVVAIRGTAPVLFSVPPKLTTARVLDGMDPLAAVLPTVRYDVEKFRWANPNGYLETWRVLVYSENSDTQKRQLEVTANFVLWMAGPFAPPASRRP